MAFPQQRISLSRESWGVKIGNPKTQENLHPHPAFLQNRILAQAKSARSIKRFRILHGRLLISLPVGEQSTAMMIAALA
jgi:hypothetical protein